MTKFRLAGVHENTQAAIKTEAAPMRLPSPPFLERSQKAPSQEENQQMIPVGHPVQGAFSQALLGVVAAVRHQKCRAQGQDPSCDPLEPCVRTACEVMDSHKKTKVTSYAPQLATGFLSSGPKTKGFVGLCRIADTSFSYF